MAHPSALPADRAPQEAVSLTSPILPVFPCEPHVLHEIHSAAIEDMPAHLVAPPAVPAPPHDAVQTALEVDSDVPLAQHAAPVVPYETAVTAALGQSVNHSQVLFTKCIILHWM